MDRQGTSADIEQIVRGLTAAAKSLRLYPPTSPIPRQAIESTWDLLSERLAGEPALTFKVARDGLSFAGATVAAGSPGAADLASALADHGVADVTFMPGVSGDDLIAFLTGALAKPDDLRDAGGLQAKLEAEGVTAVRTTSVVLTVTDEVAEEIEDVDAFLLDLISDPDKIAVWLSTAAKGDRAMLAAGLSDLVEAAGPERLPALLDSLSRAFLKQDTDGRDAVLALAAEQGDVRGVLADVLGRVPARDVAGSLAVGGFGRNMLSMSSALSRLPLAERFGEVMAQVQEILPGMGRDAKELALLEHMVEVRNSVAPEPSVADAQPVYRKVAELASLDEGQVSSALDDVLTSTSRTDQAAAATMLRLLDQQDDLALYRRSLDGLAAMVPSLIERADLVTASHIIEELAAREAQGERSWPELTAMLRAAVADATSARAMRALIAAAAADPESVPYARAIMQRAGEASQAAFVEEAIGFKPDGLRVAEAVVGRRLVDMLAASASRIGSAQVAPVVAFLGREADPRPSAAVEALMRKPDEQIRREVAAGLGVAGGPVAVRHLSTLLRDASPEVAAAAVRALSRGEMPGASSVLAARLAEIDADGKDFPLAREIIGALARFSDEPATTALQAIAGRRALMKRGHFAEVNALAAQALGQRKGGE